jgi:hypothetical protein
MLYIEPGSTDSQKVWFFDRPVCQDRGGRSAAARQNHAGLEIRIRQMVYICSNHSTYMSYSGDSWSSGPRKNAPTHSLLWGVWDSWTTW